MSAVSATSRCRCALCILQDIETLLASGRTAMAMGLLGELRAAIEGRNVHAKGRQGGPGRAPAPGQNKRPPPPARRSTAASRPGKQQASAKSHQLLAAALAEGRITVERVAELLRVGPREVEQIAAGRVGLARSAWRRLLGELE
jgi:hypothetical protein